MMFQSIYNNKQTLRPKIVRYSIRIAILMLPSSIYCINRFAITPDRAQNELRAIEHLWLQRFCDTAPAHTDSFRYYHTDIKDPRLNTTTLFISADEEQIIRDIGTVLANAQQQKVPFLFELPCADITLLTNYSLSQEVYTVMAYPLQKLHILDDADNVRRLQAEDIDRWLTVFNDIFGEHEKTYTDAFRKVIDHNVQQPQQSTLMVEHYCGYDGNLLVAIGTICINGIYAEIRNIGVHPSARNKGLGTKIIHVLMRRAQTCHAEYCILYAASPQARKVYERIGFIPMKTVTWYQLQEP